MILALWNLEMEGRMELVAGANYRCTFERIGRSRDVEPLEVVAPEDADDLAEQVHRYARRFLLSRDVGVTLDLDTMRGTIFAGMHNGGTFTIEAVAR